MISFCIHIGFRNTRTFSSTRTSAITNILWSPRQKKSWDEEEVIPIFHEFFSKKFNALVSRRKLSLFKASIRWIFLVFSFAAFPFSDTALFSRYVFQTSFFMNTMLALIMATLPYYECVLSHIAFLFTLAFQRFVAHCIFFKSGLVSNALDFFINFFCSNHHDWSHISGTILQHLVNNEMNDREFCHIAMFMIVALNKGVLQHSAILIFTFCRKPFQYFAHPLRPPVVLATATLHRLLPA